MIIFYFSYIVLVTIKYSGVRHTQNTYNGIGMYDSGEVGGTVWFSGEAHTSGCCPNQRTWPSKNPSPASSPSAPVWKAKFKINDMDICRHINYDQPRPFHILCLKCVCVHVRLCLGVCQGVEFSCDCNTPWIIFKTMWYTLQSTVCKTSLCRYIFFSLDQCINVFLLVLLTVGPKRIQDYTYLSIVLKGGI
jgi:hypothetical protein